MHLTELIDTLLNDKSSRVSESAEITESKILQHRKKNKDLNLAQADKLKVDFEKDLAMREKKEMEESKKREETELSTQIVRGTTLTLNVVRPQAV